MFRQRVTLFLALMLVGGLLFFARLYFGEPEPPAPAVPEPILLDVTSDEFFRYCAEYQIDFGAASDAQRLIFFQNFLEQELLYRESLGGDGPWKDPVVQRLLLSNRDYLALDQVTPELLDELVMNDAAIRRHLVRQARHRLSHPADAEPARDVLRSFHANHPERFTAPARLDLRQYRYAAPDDAASALARATASGNEPAGAPVSGLPVELNAAAHADISRYFGVAFADRVFELAAGEGGGDWQGPVDSGLGSHLVMLSEYRPEGLAPFDDAIINQVRGQWLNEQRALVYRERIAAMKRDARVILNGREPVAVADFAVSDLYDAL